MLLNFQTGHKVHVILCFCEETKMIDLQTIFGQSETCPTNNFIMEPRNWKPITMNIYAFSNVHLSQTGVHHATMTTRLLQTQVITEVDSSSTLIEIANSYKNFGLHHNSPTPRTTNMHKHEQTRTNMNTNKKHVRPIVKRQGFNRLETSWKHLKTVKKIKECLSVPPGACIATVSPPSSHGNQHRRTSCSPAAMRKRGRRVDGYKLNCKTQRHCLVFFMHKKNKKKTTPDGKKSAPHDPLPMASQPKATGLGFESGSASLALSFFLAAWRHEMAENLCADPKSCDSNRPCTSHTPSVGLNETLQSQYSIFKKVFEVLAQGTSSNPQ